MKRKKLIVALLLAVLFASSLMAQNQGDPPFPSDEERRLYLESLLFASESDDVKFVKTEIPDPEPPLSDRLEFYFNAENALEYVVGGGIDNELDLEAGLHIPYRDDLTFDVIVSSFIHLLEDKSSSIEEGDTEHYNSAYLDEATLNAYFTLAYTPIEWFTLNFGAGFAFNCRPDDAKRGYRAYILSTIGFDFDFYEKSFFRFSVSDTLLPLMGFFEKNTLLANSFELSMRYDFCRYFSDVALGLFSTLTIDTENYSCKTTSSETDAFMGDMIFMDLEFFAGLAYDPADFVSLSVAASVNCDLANSTLSLSKDRQKNPVTTIGMRVGADFQLEHIGLGIGYKPTFLEDGINKIDHTLDFSVSIGL